MNQITINHELNDDKGVFILSLDNKKVGEMFYKQYDNERIEIKHTEIDNTQRGKDLAAQLVSAAVTLVRQKDLKISSSCSYALAVLRRSENYHDVFVEL